MYIPLKKLNQIDWDEKVDAVEQLERRKKEIKENFDQEEVTIENYDWRHKYIEDLDELYLIKFEETMRELSEEFEDLTPDEKIKIAEKGKVKKNGKTFTRVRRRRRDYLPEAWFEIMDVMNNLANRWFAEEEDIRLLIWFTN